MKLNPKKIRTAIKCFNKEMSNRAIGRAIDASPTTVGKLKSIIQQTEFDIRQIDNFDDIELIQKLGFNKKKIVVNKKPQPNWLYIESELKKRDITLELLWQEYCEGHRENALSYSRFCALFREYLRANNISKRLIHKAGENIQVDFGGRIIEIYRDDGSTIKAQIFVGVLPASGYIFVYAVPSQKIKYWLECHIEMFNFFGGVPKKIITDNLKSAVIKNTKDDLVLNASYQKLAEHYDTIIMPARPKKPQDKGLVEACVKTVQTQILAKFRNRKFFSIKELNETIRPELEKLNKKKTKIYPRGRYADFLEIDLPKLQPLPKHDYEICAWKYDVKVNKFYTVKIDNCEYSVPYTYIGQNVDIRHTEKLLEVYFQRQCIATHVKNGISSIKFEHMPPDHRTHEELDPENLLKWAKSIDESVSIIFEKNLSNRSNYASSVRRLQQFKKWLINFRDDFDMIAGFEYSVCLNIYTIERIKSVLKNKTYLRMTTPTTKSVNHHKNIRGSQYFTSNSENLMESNYA